jgi:hypothetical protein
MIHHPDRGTFPSIATSTNGQLGQFWKAHPGHFSKAPKCESEIDSGGRLEDCPVEGGTGNTEVSADLFNPVSRSAAPQTSYFYAANRRRAFFGPA